MKLLHWTVFIDLLGYQELNGGVKSIESARDLINFMSSNQKVFNDLNSNLRKTYENTSYDLYEHYEISFAFISDSLIISYSPNLNKDFSEEIALRHSANTLLIILQRLRLLIYKCAYEKNIFLRGGISNDYSYIHENFAVGKGVGSAYKAEMQAKYPRVILAEDVTSNIKLMNSIYALSNFMYKVDLIKEDIDGKKYLDFNCFGRISLDANSKNPFVIKNAISNPENYKNQVIDEGGMLRVYKEAIEYQIRNALILKNSTDPEKQRLYNSLKEKYIWLSKYHNRSCEEFSNLTIAIPKRTAYGNPKILGIVFFLLELIPAAVQLKINSEMLNDLET